MSNHPVHIVDSQGSISPSSFIPFCDFAGKFMGEKIEQFETPVCTKFRTKMLDGQHCYQVDVNEVKDQVDVKKAVKHGLLIIMDFNQDRMITENSAELNGHLENNPDALIMKKKDNELAAKIYIETLGRIIAICKIDVAFNMLLHFFQRVYFTFW